ncbi:unnamed protein product [Phaeothamnion confervicola]
MRLSQRRHGTRYWRWRIPEAAPRAQEGLGERTAAHLLCRRETGGQRREGTETRDPMDDYLTKVVQLFSYLTDKDLFAEIYRQQLARRLLNQRSASDDMERAMIGKLKLRCGAQFTGKMEGMMNDLAIGVDHQNEFTAHVRELADKGEPKDLAGVDFSVQVLTTGYWPTYKALDVTLPPAMVRCTTVSAGQLLWRRRALSFANQPTHTPDASFSVIFHPVPSSLHLCPVPVFVSSYLSLQLFASPSVGSMGLSQLQEALNLPEETVKRTMHSLSCGKYKVLKREGSGGGSSSIKADDTFSYNVDFSSPMRKVRIPMANLEEAPNVKRVDEDRSIAIEAAIVRILKARKTIGHQNLVAEVLSQLSFFKPQPKVIKKKIETLIEREYIMRDPEIPNTYKYLA